MSKQNFISLFTTQVLLLVIDEQTYSTICNRDIPIKFFRLKIEAADVTADRFRITKMQARSFKTPVRDIPFPLFPSLRNLCSAATDENKGERMHFLPRI